MGITFCGTTVEPLILPKKLPTLSLNRNLEENNGRDNMGFPL
jgi:hypothetical protein